MIIKTKIITIIALTIILTVGTTTAVLMNMQNRKMIESKLQDTEFLCDVIERTIDTAMQEGKTAEVQKILENVGKSKEILSLRILSADGTVVKSTNGIEIGSKSADFLKSYFGAAEKPKLINATTINYFHAIKNRQECLGCHDNKNGVIGFIQIKHDISRNVSTFLSLKRLLVFSGIVIVLLVSVILSVLFSHFVMNPLKSLLSAINKVEAGNWEATVRIDSNDELGIIGSSFNKMIQEVNNLYKKNLAKERELSKIRLDLDHKSKLESLNSQLEFKLKELETANKAVTSLSREVKNKNVELEKAVERLKKINEIGRILSSIIETNELMKIIIQTTADLLKADKVTLHLHNSRRPAVTIQYRRGAGLETIPDFSLEVNKDFRDVFTQGKPVIISYPMTERDTGGPAVGQKIGVPLRMKGQIIGAMMLENGRNSGSFTEDEIELLTTLSNHAMVAIENAWLYESVKTNYFATIQSLVNALEANDRFTKGHSERVRILSVELGRYVGLDFKELELLEHASILHDIGKIGIDTFILQKQGKLTAKEYSLIKTHPLIGDEILGPIETLDGVRKTIIQHHERYDGNGYPYGLRGDEISLKSKILSVVDTFDAMMTDRPYRKALSLASVKDELLTNSGTQFDPYVVSAFVEMMNASGDGLLASCGYTTVFTAG
ncbi:MAG: HD domain-containing protein [Nitrospiraceae bacterium]|nr:HD domain-containing protein [Nitrospiraceae bacterium]